MESLGHIAKEREESYLVVLAQEGGYNFGDDSMLVLTSPAAALVAGAQQREEHDLLSEGCAPGE